LFGQRSKKVFKIGDTVKIKLVKVSIARAEIDFMLIEEKNMLGREEKEYLNSAIH
jgi:DNA-directed RNA polymerase subunit E'/Rpb7